MPTRYCRTRAAAGRSASTSVRTRCGCTTWPTALPSSTGRSRCAGSGPRHLAFHPDGTRAYVLNELSPTLVVCRWDAAEGALRPLAEIPVLPGTPAGDAYPSDVVVSPDGRFVWTATRGEDVLSVLAVETDAEGAAGTDGAAGLRLTATVPCGGHWPRALTESRGFLYVANERSGDVTWFAVDPDTGVPRRGGAIPVAAASCVVVG
ncbi:lactonase family protein [Streptomyces sp. INA 01156]